jgi:hypothetical protein
MLRSKMTIFLGLAVVVAIGVMTVVQTIDIYLPGPLEDVWRIIVCAQAGLTIALMAFAGFQFVFQVHIDRRDVLFRPIAALCVSYAILISFAAVEIAQRSSWHAPLSYRTPIAFLAFIIGDWSLLLLIFRLNPPISRSARGHYSPK